MVHQLYCHFTLRYWLGYELRYTDFQEAITFYTVSKYSVAIFQLKF